MQANMHREDNCIMVDFPQTQFFSNKSTIAWVDSHLFRESVSKIRVTLLLNLDTKCDWSLWRFMKIKRLRNAG